MLKTIDLFAGAGGLSLGFIQTGEFDILAAAENNPNAQKTYLRNNHSNHPIEIIPNVRGYDFINLNKQLNGIDIIIGGPPCQGFSNANRQKNHVISMNNSLIKEYFRAVREIQPKAFVMENVSMLESDTHRFYDSYIDHDDVMALKINMHSDKIIITKKTFQQLDMLHIITNVELLNQLLVPEKLYTNLNILYKNRNSSKRLSAFINKNCKAIIKHIGSYLDQLDVNEQSNFTIHNLTKIKTGLCKSQELSYYLDALSEFVEYQKALKTAKEIYDNKIICTFEIEDNSGYLIARVQSYAVIDYISAILGDTYKQKGSTINAVWFGVPQERKRFIVMGIRSDIIGNREIILPQEPTNIPNVSVADAFFDLIPYAPSYSKDAIGIPLETSTKFISTYATKLRDSNIIYNHIITKTTKEAMTRFKSLEEGQNFHCLDDSLKTSYFTPERTQNTIYLRLNSKEPSGTVVNVRKSMWIHPVLDRAISIREAARLQSFPDSFVFCGTKDSQYQQVGNAVPPIMAKAVAECLLGYIK